MRATRVLEIVYGWVSGLTRKIIAKELGVSLVTVTKYTKILEEMCAYGHMQRCHAAAGTWVHDEGRDRDFLNQGRRKRRETHP